MTAAGIARLQDGRVTPENVRPRARAAHRRKQRQGARCRLNGENVALEFKEACSSLNAEIDRVLSEITARAAKKEKET